MTIKITTYAKVGELIQGVFDMNQPFLVSNKSSKIFKTNTIVSINPIDNETILDFKSRQALELFHTLIKEKKGLLLIRYTFIKTETLKKVKDYLLVQRIY
ncbi:hypothetical protein [Flavobacterium oreochromis]|uniref:hypothetical protein n=1 Tax=Flavobacterium oreochromis TaxID=2906078 RepID=UPI0021641FB5|nr:hypothetical protein [Flavobacterium oreochromis]